MTPQEIVEQEVAIYIQENEVSPFANVEMGDEGTLNVDMDQNFETKLQELLENEGTNIEVALGDYFTEIIKDMVEKIESGELTEDDFETQETSEN